MNRRRVLAIAEKDLTEVRKNRIVIYATIALTVVFTFVMPLLLTQIPSGGGSSPEDLAAYIPPGLLDDLAGFTPEQLPIVLFLGYLLAPLFLVLPLMLASLIAAEAFVGEKERRTLEALLHTPATDRELFLGKVLASVVPAVLYAWGNFAIYAIVVNAASYPVMGRVWFPTQIWWPLMLWVAPAIALMGTAATVLISSKVSSFMEAYQTSGSLVVVVIGLLVAQMTGVIFISPLVALLVGAVFFAADGLLIWIGVRVFSRERLITRL